uniref:G_PROTEIN_RECEP_F1_2 domain-containing protein n=1 Tax=Panagrellus redivivus TaxID=6233 RepID=A0A7E4V7Y9_PANRE
MNFLNDTAPIGNGTAATDIDKDFVRQWWYLVFGIVPLVCFFGNFLVCVAVYKYKSLQTPTNYLLFSLAIADLFIGVAVMPFSIYLSVNNLHWHMPVYVCYIYCVSDVAASTSSIVHLVLISIDR